MQKVRVWDLPTRVFHWSLAVSVLAMLLTGQIGGAWMAWHFRIGYAVLTLLLFRILWGFVGGYWSRFRHFVHRPAVVLDYLRRGGSASTSIGHNPIGGYSVLAIVALLLLQGASGLMSDDDISFAGPWAHRVSDNVVRAMTTLHTGFGKLAVIGWISVHLLAIGWYRVVRQIPLTHAMLCGDKTLEQPAPASRDNGQARVLAVLLLLVCAALLAGLWA